MQRSSLFHLTVQEFERGYLLNELKRHGWNRTKTAKELGLSYRGILYKIAQHKLSPPDSLELPDCATSSADRGPGPGKVSLNAPAS
jgi:hypothetical protein